MIVVDVVDVHVRLFVDHLHENLNSLIIILIIDVNNIIHGSVAKNIRACTN